MECNEAQSELVALLQGELQADRTAAVEQHLSDCPECCAERLQLECALEQAARGVTADESPIITIVRSLLVHALRDRASDIHVRPLPGDDGPRAVEVLARVDGVLRRIALLPGRHHAAIANRLKVMSEMDVADHRRPQQGRIGITFNGAAYDLRVATFPLAAGERVVLRVLDHAAIVADWSRIGIPEREGERLRPMLASPSGLLVVAGPSGSGKTTVLYALVGALDRDRRNVVSVEEPVEYPLEGVAQVPVWRRGGQTPAGNLRALQDAGADVIMLGEIREAEDARAALEAAQAGRLVLTTMHADSAFGALARLREMGVPPFLLADGLSGILSVRLARKVCPHCRREVAPTPAQAAALGLPRDARLAEGAGCEECRNTGHRGRVGLYELLAPDGALRRLIASEAPLPELAGPARDAGWRPMAADAAEKVLAGTVPAAETVRILPDLTNGGV